MDTLRHLRFGPGMALFLIFFALALGDAVWVHDWVMTAIFLGVGILFLVAGNRMEWRAPAQVPSGTVDREAPPQMPLF